MRFTDIISPFLAWSRAAKKADTIPYPQKKNPGAGRYRGFHKNDLDKCIGCGRCEEICQNMAIGMMNPDNSTPEKGDSGLRPRVDYGRCCWCSLCVDVCSTGSLSMSNTYSWATFKADTCVYIPGKDRKAWDKSAKGYCQNNDLLQWAGSPREEMPVVSPEERKKNFMEVVEGYSIEQAAAEASRCIQCGLCVTACPAHMHIPDYLRAIAEGDYSQSVSLFFDNNPLPEVCGKVCTRECESVCAMGHQGESIAIRWLKRFACEQFESLSDVLATDKIPLEPNGKKVAIIGAGPAGLSAGYYLSRMGFETHIFEKDEAGGGIAKRAIPEYRLPLDGYGKTIGVFSDAGVNFHYNTEITPEDLTAFSSEYHAVFISAGRPDSSLIDIPGVELPGVINALDFLTSEPEKGNTEITPDIVVIGGGNVAMDAARTVVRLGAANVHAVCLESRSEMPADIEEIEEALEEGIGIDTSRGPVRIIEQDGKVGGIEFRRCVSVFDSEGRFNPVFDDAKRTTIDCDTVIIAIGQSSDLSFLPEEISAKMDIQRGTIMVDEHQYTGVANIYAGGDITPGAGDVITAIADGMRAAKAIANN